MSELLVQASMPRPGRWTYDDPSDLTDVPVTGAPAPPLRRPRRLLSALRLHRPRGFPPLTPEVSRP